MNRKILSLLTVASFALFMSACGGDDKKNGVGPEVTCEDTENCLDDEDESSSSVKSSSSSKKDNKSSSSVKEDKDKSSSSAKEDKDEDKSSSSEAKDDKSSDSKDESSSSAEETADSSSSSEEAIDSSSSSEEIVDSSSSEEPVESSSSEEPAKPVEYESTTPNLADLEVSGDTLFAIFQRSTTVGYNTEFHHNGLLALYNVATGDLLDTIQLATKNPSAVKVAGGNVYVATAGEYDAYWSLPADNTRGIEKVDLKNKKSSLFIAGSKLGGGLTDFVVDKKNNKGFVSVYYGYGSVGVSEINLSTGSVTKISGISDASGSLELDEENGLLYIGDRDGMNFMAIRTYIYDGTSLTALSNPDEEEDEYETRQPYSIKVIKGIPYVFVSDYTNGALYLNYADLEDKGLEFDQDSKLAVVNGELYVMSRGDAASISKVNTTSGEVQQSIAIGKNPYDMVAASATTAWVAYYGSPILELINTSTLSTEKLINTKEFCAVKVDATAED